MNKRQFFKKVAALVGVGAVAPLAQAATNREIELQRSPNWAVAPLAQAATNREIELAQAARSPLAGFQYHQGEKAWRRLRAGTPLELVREPDNPYDPRAVRVDWRGRKLGYIPRRENTAVSQLLDKNQSLTARIVRLRISDDPWERIEFVVCLNV